MTPRALLVLTAIFLLAAGHFAGCGDDDAQPGSPPTRFRTALESVGGGAEGTESGFGWVDIQALGERGRRLSNDLDWAAGALGPGAEQLANEPGPARVGIEPARARQILSLVGSYAIGVRFDGVETARLKRALSQSARPNDHGPWTFYDLSDTPAIPFGTPLEGLTELASHAAVRPGTAVLARFELARPALIGQGASPIETPLMAAAASCLGDVVAARTVPNNFTYLGSEAPRLFAFGVELTDSGPRDILCVLDESGSAADDAAAGMRGALDPGTSDAVTGEPMSELIESADVERLEVDGVETARAVLVPADGEDPGFLFRVFGRGSTLTYIGLREPFPGDD